MTFPLDILTAAIRVIVSLPDGSSWALHLTDEDGRGDDPTFATLTIILPEGAALPEARAYEYVESEEEGGMYMRTVGALEITVIPTDGQPL